MHPVNFTPVPLQIITSTKSLKSVKRVNRLPIPPFIKGNVISAYLLCTLLPKILPHIAERLPSATSAAYFPLVSEAPTPLSNSGTLWNSRSPRPPT